MKLAVLTALASATVGECSLRHTSAQKALALAAAHDLNATAAANVTTAVAANASVAAVGANKSAVAVNPRKFIGGNGPDDAQPAVNKSDLPFFGDSICPCIGFDNILGGETTVTFKDGSKGSYPADLGSRCEAWDNNRNPNFCMKGQTPGPDNGWCGKKWCYVDPCNCHIEVMPKLSHYVPEARYHGSPLFVSYATCGDKDDFSAKVPEVGSAGCRCIGFDNMPGSMEVILETGQKVMYPAELGGSCKAWDKDSHPSCKVANPPAWCIENWCYVDPCSCTLEEEGIVPKISAYLPNSTFTGKNLYFSYETCHSKDLWTEENHPGACVNQDNKFKCDELLRCSWKDDRCLGTELVDHPLCKGVAEHMVEKIADLEKKMEMNNDKKSGTSQLAPRFAVAVASVAAVAFAALF